METYAACSIPIIFLQYLFYYLVASVLLKYIPDQAVSVTEYFTTQFMFLLDGQAYLER